MDPALKEQFDYTRDELRDSKLLTTDRKDQLRVALAKAEASSNGAPDKLQAISETIAFWVMLGVRRELRTPEEIKTAISEAIASHTETCREHFEMLEQSAPAKPGAVAPAELADMPWRTVVKMAFLKCPVSLAIVASALILKGFGSPLLDMIKSGL